MSVGIVALLELRQRVKRFKEKIPEFRELLVLIANDKLPVADVQELMNDFEARLDSKLAELNKSIEKINLQIYHTKGTPEA